MSLFGLIVSGRLVQTDFQQVDSNKFLITIPNADSINHVVVFLTGLQPLPIDMGAAVHFSWPDSNAPPTWRYLGLVCNDKPSAIFKITNLKKDFNAFGQPTFGFDQQIVSHVAQIGISIEPIDQLRLRCPDGINGNNSIDMIPSDGLALPSGSPLIQFITKTAEHLFNYVASFSRPLPDCGSEQFVPLSSIQAWYNSYLRKLQFNPNFWREQS